MLTWLKEEPRTWRGCVAILVGVLLLSGIWTNLGFLILDAFHLVDERKAFEDALFARVKADPFYQYLGLMWDSVREEIEHRIAPLTAAVAFARFCEYYRAPKVGSQVVVVVFLLCSVIWFGWAHGGPLFVLVHGIGAGAPLGIVFLKCGGFRGGWGFLKGGACVAFIHCLINTLATINR